MPRVFRTPYLSRSLTFRNAIARQVMRQHSTRPNNDQQLSGPAHPGVKHAARISAGMETVNAEHNNRWSVITRKSLTARLGR